MSASVKQDLSRAPATLPDTISGLTPASIRSPSLSNLNNVHANGPSSIRTGLQLIPSPNDAADALQSSALQIARLQSNPEQPTARAASAAYQTQAAARTQITQQEQSVGSLKINVMA
jgi:hypothetical protein